MPGGCRPAASDSMPPRRGPSPNQGLHHQEGQQARDLQTSPGPGWRPLLPQDPLIPLGRRKSHFSSWNLSGRFGSSPNGSRGTGEGGGAAGGRGEREGVPVVVIRRRMSDSFDEFDVRGGSVTPRRGAQSSLPERPPEWRFLSPIKSTSPGLCPFLPKWKCGRQWGEESLGPGHSSPHSPPQEGRSCSRPSSTFSSRP